MHDRPSLVGVESVTFISDHQRAGVPCAEGGIELLHNCKLLADAFKGENVVILAADYNQLFRCDQDREVAHVEILGDTRNIVAGAVVKIYDRIAVGRERA